MSVSTLKLVLLGEGRVGKTSLSARFVSDYFDEGQVPTTAAAFSTKRMVIEGATCELAIWDTAGQERFHSLGPIYYRNADAALLVFDVTDPGSFRRVRDWVKELRQMVGPNIALSIAANKQDLVAAEGRAERAVPDDRSRAFAQTVGAAYYRTSAKTGAGIEQAFTQTAQEAFKHHQAKKASTATSTTQQIGRSAACWPPGIARQPINLENKAARPSSCC